MPSQGTSKGEGCLAKEFLRRRDAGPRGDEGGGMPGAGDQGLDNADLGDRVGRNPKKTNVVKLRKNHNAVM